MLTYAAFSSNLCNDSNLNAHTAKDFFLRVFHPAQISQRRVVESVQMQKPVHDVQFDLAHQRIAKFAGVPSCGFDTDKNFAIAKSYYVGRATFAEELEMYLRNAPIGNQPHENFVQLA